MKMEVISGKKPVSESVCGDVIINIFCPHI